MRTSRKLAAAAQGILVLPVVLGGALSAGVGPARQPAGTHPMGQVIGEAEFTPPACTEMFPDVPASSDFCPWIEQLVADGVSAGCGDGTNFCPDQPVTRQQLALFLEKAMRGTASWDVDADLLDGLDSADFVTAASQTWASTRRRFYLTVDMVEGSGALTACAAGYHMAAITEIQDISNLVYDTTLGTTLADSGTGPPTDFGGWARTGYVAYPSGPGKANCLAWTSSVEDGTVFFLATALWGSYSNDDGFSDAQVPMNASWWRAQTWGCYNTRSVWCVQD